MKELPVDCLFSSLRGAILFGVIAFSMTAVPADEPDAIEEKPTAKSVEPKPVDAKQVLEVFEALGNLVDDVAAVAAGAPIAADPIEQQFAPQVQMVVNSELHFVQKVCQPTPKQYQNLKLVGERAAKKTAKEIAQVQKKMQQGIRPGQQFDWPDPRSVVAEMFAKEIATTMSADQVERYQVELTKRRESHKRAGLLNLVSKLDRDLLLSTEQRTKLTETLDKNWKNSWAQQLEVFVYGDQFAPVLPDDQVLPILNEKQKTVWKSTPKNQNQLWGFIGFGFMQAGVAIDEAVELEAVDEKKLDEKTEKQDNTRQNSKTEEGS